VPHQVTGLNTRFFHFTRPLSERPRCRSPDKELRAILAIMGAAVYIYTHIDMHTYSDSQIQGVLWQKKLCGMVEVDEGGSGRWIFSREGFTMGTCKGSSQLNRPGQVSEGQSAPCFCHPRLAPELYPIKNNIHDHMNTIRERDYRRDRFKMPFFP
jgi:hypothetical protein